jgi:hypothetical protein
MATLQGRDSNAFRQLDFQGRINRVVAPSHPPSMVDNHGRFDSMATALQSGLTWVVAEEGFVIHGRSRRFAAREPCHMAFSAFRGSVLADGCGSGFESNRLALVHTWAVELNSPACWRVLFGGLPRQGVPSRCQGFLQEVATFAHCDRIHDGDLELMLYLLTEGINIRFGFRV